MNDFDKELLTANKGEGTYDRHKYPLGIHIRNNDQEPSLLQGTLVLQHILKFGNFEPDHRCMCTWNKGRFDQQHKAGHVK